MNMNCVIADESCPSSEYCYQIDYIVRGFEKEKSHFKRKLKKVKALVPPSVLMCMDSIEEQKKMKVSTDKKNACVRIHGPKLKVGKLFGPTYQEERIVEEGGKRVKYVFLTNAYFPSRASLEAYNEIALHVRRILESG